MNFPRGSIVERSMSVRWAVLLTAVSGCASAPVRDTNAERIDAAMAPEKHEMPEGLVMGDHPALAPSNPNERSYSMSRRGRIYRHSTPRDDDFWTRNVSVPPVTTGGNPPPSPPPPHLPLTPEGPYPAITLGVDAPPLSAPFPERVPVQRVGFFKHGKVQRAENDFPGITVDGVVAQ